MICRAKTALKKTDTDGRIPAYTLDQYVRNELCQQFVSTINSELVIRSSEGVTDSATVDFSAELILLTPAQWRELKGLINGVTALLPADLQTSVWQLLNDVDTCG